MSWESHKAGRRSQWCQAVFCLGTWVLLEGGEESEEGQEGFQGSGTSFLVMNEVSIFSQFLFLVQAAVIEC